MTTIDNSAMQYDAISGDRLGPIGRLVVAKEPCWVQPFFFFPLLQNRRQDLVPNSEGLQG